MCVKTKKLQRITWTTQTQIESLLKKRKGKREAGSGFLCSKLEGEAGASHTRLRGTGVVVATTGGPTCRAIWGRQASQPAQPNTHREVRHQGRKAHRRLRARAEWKAKRERRCRSALLCMARCDGTGGIVQPTIPVRRLGLVDVGTHRDQGSASQHIGRSLS